MASKEQVIEMFENHNNNIYEVRGIEIEMGILNQKRKNLDDRPYINEEDIERIRIKAKELTQRGAQLKLLIERVDNALNLLTPEERDIIEHRDILGMTWRRTAKETSYSISGGKRLRDKALLKICDKLHL